MLKEMSYGAHMRAIVVLGLPLIGSQLAQFAVHMTDTLMLGWYSVDALAAGVLGTSFAFILFILGSGFAGAVVPLVAAADSQGDPVQIRRVTRMGMWAVGFFSVVVMIPMIYSAPILIAAGQDPELSLAAQSYLRISAPGMLLALLATVLRMYLSALERANAVFYASLAAVGLNIVMNYAFIFGNFGAPELGIRGAAIASLGVNALLLIYMGLYAIRKLPEHELFVRFWRPDWEAFREVVRLGTPIGITSLAEVGLFNLATLMIGWLGTIQLAAHGIALQMAGAVFMVHLGLSAAATIRAGRAYGIRDEAHLRRGALVATLASFILSLFGVALFVLYPEFLVGAFIAPDDPLRGEIIVMGTGLLLLAGIFQVADSLQVMSLGLLRGLQDARIPMWIAVLSYWGLGAPASYYLGTVMGYGAQGVWGGLVIGLSAAAVLLTMRFWMRSVKIGQA
ncbi:MATE family efflux transporter [Falsihalocynthiibacter arcticus]|uniref:Multidrug-efflux transporter n=1 Tax=Falsihalocynthiibacter arcticus TaxID=1579316 RepID=A0A126UVT1_9RHOB|nr:MATE family efflux transporter [Falsihalocynthiibacter arcticus]AML49977.1 MATE family efflux transporter [Falsihalocynthiibacter arcticus]